MATTETRKSSREPQVASRARSIGSIREPNRSMAAMNAAALRTARPSSGRPSFTFSDWQHGQEHYDGQVLDDEHPDHHPCRQGAEDPLLAKGLEDYSGAR